MRETDYRDTLIVVFGLGFAILTGYARQAAIASQLGASRGADIYLVAYALPEFVFIALPIILTPAFIPIFSRLRQAEGELQSLRFALRVARAVSLFLLAITAAAAIGAPFYLAWMSPGFTSAERRQTLMALYPMLPGILLVGMATLASSISQNYRRFLRPALMTAVYNLAFITALFFLPIDQPTSRASWGVTIGAATTLLIF
jgi:peptidoglycan biosynthesis protein MviN/MurJ (putative lipid II flippase)